MNGAKVLYRSGLCLLSFCLSLSCLGQEETDEDTLSRRATAAFYLAFDNADSALMIARQVREEAEAAGNKFVVASACNSIGWAFRQKGNYDSARHYLLKAREGFQKENNALNLARVSMNLAEVYTSINQFATAIQFLLEMDSIAKEIDEITISTDVKRQLGIIYREAGDYGRAIVYFKEALSGFEHLGNYEKYIATANSLGILYRTRGMTDSSLAILKKNLQMATDRQTSSYQMAMIYENLGETYFTVREFTEALKYFSRAFTIFRQLKNKGDMAYEAFCMGRTYKALEHYTLAEKYLLESFHLSDSLKMTNYQEDASAELAALYAVTGNWQQGYKFLQKTGELRDSIAVADQITQTNELKEKYESEKQAQEIVLLRTQNELTQADNRKNRLLQYIFIILFLASVLIGWLLFNRIRISKRLEQLTLRNRIAGDLHDDIGSALSSIDISSRVALAKKENSSVIQENLAKISQQARKTMDSMSDIVWSINPANDSFENMLSRMREFATGICEPEKIEFVMSEPEDKQIIITEADKRRNIFLIFKESVNNACKYSGCSQLKVSFEKTAKNRLLMRISDNGKGFDEETVKKGNGLQNIRNRAAQIDASVAIQSIIDEGTTIELAFSV